MLKKTDRLDEHQLASASNPTTTFSPHPIGIMAVRSCPPQYSLPPPLAQSSPPQHSLSAPNTVFFPGKVFSPPNTVLFTSKVCPKRHTLPIPNGIRYPSQTAYATSIRATFAPNSTLSYIYSSGLRPELHQ